MTRLGLLFFASLLSFNGFAQIPQQKEIDKIFADWDNKHSPGASLGIIKDGKLIYSRGYGMANLDYGIPNSSKSVFRIASTSKQFTAASIVLLIQQGRLKFEDPLTKFFPDFPDYAKKITVRHLVNHTSGIRDYLSLAYLSGHGANDFYTDKDIMKWLVNQKTINFQPGEEFLYSNSGYWLMGKIVEKVAGVDMAQFAKKEIFDPLKMNNTHFHNNHNLIVKNRASGYAPTENGQFEIDMTTLDMIGDGGIFTTIEDMKIWDDASYHSDVLNKEFWEMMEQVGSLNDGQAIEYASGLGVRDHNGLKMVSHGGAFVGYRAQYVRIPEEKFSVILFANRGDARPTQKALQIVDLFLSSKYKEKAKQSTEPSKQTKEVKLSKKELKRWVGDYWYDSLGFSRSIALKDDTLYYERGGRGASKLIAIGKNKFVMEESKESVLEFSVNKENKRVFSFRHGDAKPDLAVAYKTKNYSSKELKSFVGEYYSDELQSTYKLAVKDKQLTLSVNGSEPSNFEPVKEDLLVNPQIGAFQFNRGKSKKVESFTLSAGRVKNLTFIRL